MSCTQHFLSGISIHSAARAETGSGTKTGIRINNFNPLRREGGDLKQPQSKRMRFQFQSTPPRGRRRNIKRFNRPYTNFNPLRREGGDGKSVKHAHWRKEFQSTPPRGRRHYRDIYMMVDMNFNPLRREGGDTRCRRHSLGMAKFQSTPPRGRRRAMVRGLAGQRRFQSTPPRGRRRLTQSHRYHNIADFNPLRREGGDG